MIVGKSDLPIRLESFHHLASYSKHPAFRRPGILVDGVTWNCNLKRPLGPRALRATQTCASAASVDGTAFQNSIRWTRATSAGLRLGESGFDLTVAGSLGPQW